MTESVTLAVEGTIDAAAAKRLLGEAGLQPGPEYIKHGKGALDQRLNGFNNAARFSCWLVLRDLDLDADCAPVLRHSLLPAPAPRMRLQIAVRAVETWFLADQESISSYLAVAQAKVPKDPESIPQPKRALVDLARQSRKKGIREALVPLSGTTARVGPGYAALLIEFATKYWRPAVAARRSQSLAGLREFLRAISQHGCGRR